MRDWSPVILLSLVFVVVASLIAYVASLIGSSLFGDWQLIFQQMTSRTRWLTLCCACAIAVALIAKLHEYERQLISKSLGTILLSLRLALVLIVFLTLLEPIWLWAYEDESLGRVVVAFDVSESMDSSDDHARLSEKLRWGRALGMFGNGEKAVESEEWVRALESGDKPIWVSTTDEPDPQRRLQRSVQRQQDIEENLETVTTYSRLELAAKAFTATTDSVLDSLAKNAETELAIFATNKAQVDDGYLKGFLEGQEVQLKRKTSDLSQALNAALAADSEIPLAGLVLVSDGRDTSETDQQKLVQRLAGIGVPIQTVLVGSEDRPRDISISYVEAPETVFEDDTPVVKAIVHAFGFEQEEITVYLEDLDDLQREPLKQVLTPNKSAAEVSFSLDDLDLGRHRFRVRTDIADFELRDDNNSRELSLSVVDDKAQVLILEGEGRWEFRFLHTALQRDKRVEVDEIVFEQPYLGVLDEPFFTDQLTKLEPADGNGTQFSKYDCVIIGDVSSRHLPLEQWRNLEKYVRDEGGTIVMTAGKRDFPLAYQGTAVNSLLPIENLRIIDLAAANQSLPPPQRGFRFSITPDGEQLSMFQLGNDVADSRRIWSQLPGHSWGITGDAKGGATVFAAALPAGEQLTLENERQNGIAVQHFVGNGQVLWLGIDSTWRWRFRVGDQYHHRFWGQLVRWAVSFKASAANKNVRLGLTQSVINEAESTRIQARWNDRFLAQHPGLKTVAVVEATDGSDFRKRVDLKPADNRPFMHEADLSDLSPGDYRVTLETPGIQWDTDSPEVILIVREDVSQELADISANRILMQEIAEKSGGQFFQLDEIHKLPGLFADTQHSTSVREEIPLWSHWLILVLFSIVATTEWIIRKVNGLP